jgi:hypothetical protein
MAIKNNLERFSQNVKIKEVIKKMIGQDIDCSREAQRVLCAFKGINLTSPSVSSEVQCIDLSTKGMGITASEPFRVNSQASIELVTKRNSPLQLTGKVCWCRKLNVGRWRLGIRFNRPLAFELKRLI